MEFWYYHVEWFLMISNELKKLYLECWLGTDLVVLRHLLALWFSFKNYFFISQCIKSRQVDYQIFGRLLFRPYHAEYLFFSILGWFSAPEIHEPYDPWTVRASDIKPTKLFDIHGYRINRTAEEKIRKSICQSTKKCRRKKDAIKILKSCLSNRDSWTTTVHNPRIQTGFTNLGCPIYYSYQGF